MMTLVIWDVQHGSAAYLQTPNGKHIVFDLGKGTDGDSTFSPLQHLKQAYGVTQLDAVVITHPHTDHLEDIDNFDELSPRVLHRPIHLNNNEIKEANRSSEQRYTDEFLKIHRRYTGPLTLANDPFYSNNNGGVNFQFFQPKKCSTSNINNHSQVAVISYCGYKILFPGDNEPPSWNELLGNPIFVEAIKGTHILIAPHHGRESAYSSELFDKIYPLLTIISDGPEGGTSTVDKYSYKSAGWKIFKPNGAQESRKCLTTRKDGAITIQCGRDPSNQTFMQVSTAK